MLPIFKVGSPGIVVMGVVLKVMSSIPVPFTGWTFFTFNCCKNCLFQKTKINEKEAEDVTFF